MTVTVGINGFGRIGRCTLMHIAEAAREDVKVVKINATGPLETAAHLIRYDSVHGRFANDVVVQNGTMDVGQGPIRMFSTYDMDELDWTGVDVVLECTGNFNDGQKAAKHRERGAKKVLISAPAKNVQKTIVFGVNDDLLEANDNMISNGSCTTNCLAPMAKALHEAIGIENGLMTTIHSYTGDQPTLDRRHKDLYRARAAASSMIPTSTGAAKAVGLVLPELAGKLNGSAVRVPTPNVSMIDLVFDAGRETTVEEVNAAIKAAADGPMKGVLGYSDQPLVSADFNHDPHSSTFAADGTNVTEGTLVRVLSWYDNEWGFATRMSDTALHMAKFL